MYTYTYTYTYIHTPAMQVRISMCNNVDSLNVGVACGVLLNGFVEREPSHR